MPNNSELKEKIAKILQEFLKDSVTKGDGEPLLRRAIRNNAVEELTNLTQQVREESYKKGFYNG